jgi:opacity protein-like surface antigen
MGSLKVYATVAGCLALAASMTTARAADLLSAPPPPPVYEPVPDVGGGWYLRGDVGVGTYSAGRLSNASAPELAYHNRDFGTSSFVGAGVGYQLTSWFRADVTGEFRGSTGWSWHDRSSWLVPGTPSYVATGNERTRFGHKAGVFLANGYFDLGTWYGISLFAGAGVGVAHHSLTGGSTDTLNVFVPNDGSALLSTTSGGYVANKSQTNLAWALHAGVAYDLTSNLKLELAYRYLNMGSVQTGVVNCYCNATYSGFKVKDMESHDIKLGLRWALGGPAPSYEPAPLMRKY